MHAAVPGSSSLSNALVRAIDPLTSASTAGDIRALAALATAVSAALMLLLLRRYGTPASLALLLSCSILTVVMPVSTAMTATLALQMLLAAHAPAARVARRIVAMTSLTVASSPSSTAPSRCPPALALPASRVPARDRPIGAHHASFLRSRAIVWIAAATHARPHASPRPCPLSHRRGGSFIPSPCGERGRGEGELFARRRPVAPVAADPRRPAGARRWASCSPHG